MADDPLAALREALRLSPNNIPLRQHLADSLLQSGRADEAEKEFREALSLAPNSFALKLGLARAYFRLGKNSHALVIAEDEEKGPPKVEIERPKMSFADVGGMEDVKEQIELKIIAPLKHPDLYKAYGKKTGGGILMYGPPGCGKTYLARATAGEIKASFISVGINEVLDMWIGNSERNLHAIFEEARGNTPCVLFFDEVDALGASRADMRQHAGRQLINQFLAEMDGVEKQNEGVLILAATNAPWHLDSAFRRPGRFDRILFVPPPDVEAREGILELMCKDKPTDKMDFGQVAKKTEHFSGADLKAVIDIAVEKKLRNAMKEGTPRPLTTDDLIAAAKLHKATTREWFATARNYALYSNQGGAYDEVTTYMRAAKLI